MPTIPRSSDAFEMGYRLQILLVAFVQQGYAHVCQILSTGEDLNSLAELSGTSYYLKLRNRVGYMLSSDY